MEPDQEQAIDTGESYEPAAEGNPEQGGAPDQSSGNEMQGLDTRQDQTAGNESEGLNTQKPDNRSPGGKAASYISKLLLGAGAVDPTQLDGMAQAIDPEGSMPPGDRQIALVHNAVQQGGVEKGAPIVQGNRVAFGAKQSFGLAALQGTAQKPPNLDSAVDAANQAEQHVLDGSNVHFAKSPNGVTATVIGADGKPQQQIPLTTQQFGQYLNIGQDGQFDKLMKNGVVDTLRRLSKGQNISGTSKVAGGVGEATETKNEFNMSPEPKSLGKSNFGKTPSTLNLSGDDEYRQPEPEKGQYDDELRAKAQRMFPSSSQNTQREQWMAGQETEEANRQNKVEVASEVGRNATERARVAGGLKNEGEGIKAKAKTDTASIYGHAKEAVAQHKLAEALAIEEKKDARSDRTSYLKSLQTAVASGATLDENQKKIWDHYRQQAEASIGGGQPSQTAAPSGKAAAPPAGKPQGIPQGAKQYNGKWYTRGPNGEAVPVQ